MSGLVFLTVVVVISVVGGFVLWFRSREPQAWDNDMREFNRTLTALSPDTPLPPTRKPGDGAPARNRRAPSK